MPDSPCRSESGRGWFAAAAGLDHIGFGLLLIAAFLCPLVFSGLTREADAIKTLVFQTATAAGLVVLLLRIAAACRIALVDKSSSLLLGFFASVNVLSLLWSGFPDATIGEAWRVFILVTLSFLTCEYSRSLRRRRALVFTIMASCLLVAVYGVVQKAGFDPIQWGSNPADRVFSTVGNPNMLAGFLVLILPLFVCIAFARTSWSWRICWMGAGSVLLAALIFTLTRGGLLLGLPVSAVVLIVIHRRRLLRGIWRVVLPLLLVAGIVLVVMFGRPMRLIDALSMDPAKKASQSSRLILWQGAWRALASHPLLGTGAGTFTILFPRYREPDYQAFKVRHNTLHTHCEYLEVASELGIAGLVLFLACVWRIFWQGWKRASSLESGLERAILIGMLAGVAGLLVHNLVSVNLRWPTCSFFFWLFLGLIMGSGRSCSDTAPPAACRSRLPLIAAVLAAGVFIGGVWQKKTLQFFQSEVAFRHGEMMSDRGLWLKAIRSLEEALQLYPSNCRAGYLLGCAWFEVREYDRAKDALHRVQGYAPDFAQIHYNLGAVHLALGEWGEAAEEYERQRAIGGLPDNFQMKRLLATLRSNATRKEDPYFEALQRLVELNPDDHVAQNRLGNCLFQRGRLVAAKECYELALAASPGYVPALNNLAGVFFHNKEYQRAYDICRNIVRIQPDEVVPRVNLGKACMLLGRRQEAIGSWQDALALDPQNAEARKHLEVFGKEPAP